MPSPLRNTSPGLLRGFWQRLISILSQIFGSNIAPPISTTGNRPRKSDLSPSDNQFLQRLFDAAIIPISETLGASREDVRKALVQSRAGEPNELAQTSHLRVECAFKKVSPSRLAVTVSIIFLKDDKPLVSTVRLEASWDELPSQIRSEFIRKNPPEVICVITEHNQTT